MGIKTGNDFLDGVLGLDEPIVEQAYIPAETDQVANARQGFEGLGLSLNDGQRMVDDLCRCLYFSTSVCVAYPAEALLVLMKLYSIPSLETDGEKNEASSEALNLAKELFEPRNLLGEWTEKYDDRYIPQDSLEFVEETKKCIVGMNNWRTSWLFKSIGYSNAELIEKYKSLATAKWFLGSILGVSVPSAGVAAGLGRRVLAKESLEKIATESLKTMNNSFVKAIASRIGSKGGFALAAILAAAYAGITVALNQLEHEALVRTQLPEGHTNHMIKDEYAEISDSYKSVQEIKPYWNEE